MSKTLDTHTVYNTGDWLVPQAGSTLLEFMRNNPNTNLEIVIKGHSVQQHRLLMAYARWVWEDYFRDQVPSFETFRKEVSKIIGWVDKDDFISLTTGERMTEISAKSWSHSAVPRGEFNNLVKLVSDFGHERTGIDLETWAKKRSEFIQGTAQ